MPAYLNHLPLLQGLVKLVARSLTAWRAILAPALLTHSQAHFGESSALAHCIQAHSKLQVAKLALKVSCRFILQRWLTGSGCAWTKGTDVHAHAITGKRSHSNEL